MPDLKPDHSRAVGDTLSKFAVQVTREGLPVNLSGLSAKFVMSDLNGNIIVNEASASISNALLGHVEYDFQPSEVDEIGFYRGWFRIYGAGEPDTYPASQEGIIIEIFDTSPAETTEDGIPSDKFLDLATAPRRTRTVEGTVEERSIDDLIKADRYLKQQTIESTPWGVRTARTKPPGTCS